MLRAALGAAALICTVGLACARRADSLPPTPASGFALLWRGATLYSQPSTKKGDRHARLYDGVFDADQAIDDVWVVRIVADHGPFVEVENLAWEEVEKQHCYQHDTDLESYGLRLRVFVRRDELRQVTTREVTVDGADGSSVTLAPGVALLPEKGGHVARFDGLRLAARLPADALGIGYQPQAWYSDELTNTWIAGDQPLTFGAGEISDADGTSAVAPADPRGKVSIEVVGTCGKVHLAAPAERTLGSGQFESLGNIWGYGCAHCMQVEAGTPLFYPDGRPAGVALREVILEDWKNFAEVGELSCGDQLLRHPAEGEQPPPSWYLRICVKKADVTR